VGGLLERLDRGVAPLLCGDQAPLRSGQVLLQLGAQALLGVERSLRALVGLLGPPLRGAGLDENRTRPISAPAATPPTGRARVDAQHRLGDRHHNGRG